MIAASASPRSLSQHRALSQYVAPCSMPPPALCPLPAQTLLRSYHHFYHSACQHVKKTFSLDAPLPRLQSAAMGGQANGNNLSPLKRARIIELLCAGQSINQVAKATRSHWHAVRGVQWANAAKVEERKLILAERSEHAAVDALDLLHGKLLSQGKQITPTALVPIFGVLIDKAIALRSDPTIHVEHSHAHIHAHISPASYQQLLERLPKRLVEPNPHQPEHLQPNQPHTETVDMTLSPTNKKESE